MAKKNSAGVLLYRNHGHVEVFLVHPGGPFWANKDAGAWSLPKGELAEGEDCQRPLNFPPGWPVNNPPLWVGY